MNPDTDTGMKESFGRPGPLKGVGFQPQVDRAYQTAGSTYLRF